MIKKTFRIFLIVLFCYTKSVQADDQLCGNLFGKILKNNIDKEWALDTNKKYISVDKNGYFNDPKSHQLVWRGLLETHFIYLKTNVLNHKNSTWDLIPELSSIIEKSKDMRFISLQSKSEDLVVHILEPMRMGGSSSAIGIDNPLLRMHGVLAHFGPQALYGETTAKDVFANTLIYKMNNDETLIGRMYIDRGMSTEEKKEYYFKIVDALKDMKSQNIIVETADLVHVKLYQKMGFKLSNKVQESYGEEKIYVLDSTVDRLTEALTLLFGVRN